MTRLEKVIEQVKAIRKVDKKHRAWIYNDEGKIGNNVICGDVLPVLEMLKEYEVNVNNEWIERFRQGAYNYYGYNYGTCIDSNLSIWYKNNNPMGLVCVHLYGDARGGFSDFFAIKNEDYDNALEFIMNEMEMQYIDLDEDGRYTADINIFSETYDVYDNVEGKTIGSFYCIELEDLMNEIKKEVAV